jgi:TolB protein
VAASLAAAAPTHSPPGHIAFVQDTGGRASIWTMNAFGTALTRLATGTSPAWNLTGRRIAYVSRGDVWTMGADGSGKRRLTRTGGAADPAWAPDGSRIVFTRAASLYVVDESGANVRRLTRGPFDGSPTWSPDGRVVAFARKVRSAPADVWTVPAEGGEPSLLIKHAAEPAWSLDGRRLAFVSQRAHFGRTCAETCAFSTEVYVADADGTHQHRVTRTKADEHSPTWSPDGLWLAMSSDRAGRSPSIWLVSERPPEVIRATVAAGRQLQPAWSL